MAIISAHMRLSFCSHNRPFAFHFHPAAQGWAGLKKTGAEVACKFHLRHTSALIRRPLPCCLLHVLGARLFSLS